MTRKPKKDATADAVAGDESAGRWEYRVIWRREGQDGDRRAIYQTLVGAERCADRQRTAADEMDWVRVKPLVYGPVIDARPVGIWSPFTTGGCAASEEVSS